MARVENDEIITFLRPGKIPILSSDFETAGRQATQFCVLWDNGLDGNSLIAEVRKLSPLALEIVRCRFDSPWPTDLARCADDGNLLCDDNR